MKKWMFPANVLALLCATAVFGGSAVFAASNVETGRAVEPVVSEESEAPLQDDFVQEREPGIAELVGGDVSSFPEESESGDTVSILPASSVPENESTSEPTVSVPVSSASAESKPEPVSSREEVASSLPESSLAESRPASGESSSSLSASSGELSSDPLSSGDSFSEPELSSQEEPLEEEPVSSEDFTTEEPPDDGAFYADSELLNMVAGAVQREIVGINTPPSPACYEAYKAQAVACRTYMEYQRQKTGSYPSMSYAKPMPQTLELVSEVLDKLLYYNGSLINAPYHAASGGATQSAVYVWGYDVPYLVGVPSAYDDYASSYRISVSKLEDRLFLAGLDTSGDPSEWFDMGSVAYTDGGFVDTIEICGSLVTGRTLRESILGTANLKSPKILDIEYDGEFFTFYTMGYGHGVGLSQQGAIGYASREGWDYESILLHYYPGAYVE